jgi:hypothetical protein
MWIKNLYTYWTDILNFMYQEISEKMISHFLLMRNLCWNNNT